MVRLRQAKYCNLKLFLVLLVVFGHLIEPRGHWLYRAIYAFHMPAFALLSGMFSRKNGLRMAKKLFLWYIILQSTAVLSGKTSAFTPYWHLWYLFTNVSWILLAQALERLDRRLVLLGAVLLGCLIGYAPFVGRTLSISRTVVFFAYFWCGRCLGADVSWKKYKIALCVAAVLATIGLFFLRFPTKFLYQATAYGAMRYGGLLRLACYGIGFVFCFLLLVFVPNRRLPFTKMGSDTLAVYIFHAPIVRLLRQYDFSVFACAILSVAIVWMFYKIQQGSRCFCGIAQERGRRWHPFKSSTSNTPKRSTDSCSP